MHEVVLKLKCKRPRLVVKSLKPDIKNNEKTRVTIEIGSVKRKKVKDKSIVIRIKSEKLSHLKAIVNSYISLIATLDEIDTISD